ncbi:uncharacterized protein LOC110052102 [Orbicella faveolata]|uniref:uncharacterized protein LOC110052102 n=1 Tax=Orbicella faveolata TaxID=48498 RepID=UPI0009E5C95F|nr:uncharacterized protein LOC110052102 [Orbicella faveolata]
MSGSEQEGKGEAKMVSIPLSSDEETPVVYFELSLYKVLGQYIENLMSASSVFQPANPDSKKRYEQHSVFCHQHCLPVQF